jgi:hypothetical protein
LVFEPFEMESKDVRQSFDFHSDISDGSKLFFLTSSPPLAGHSTSRRRTCSFDTASRMRKTAADTQ